MDVSVQLLKHGQMNGRSGERRVKVSRFSPPSSSLFTSLTCMRISVPARSLSTSSSTRSRSSSSSPNYKKISIEVHNAVKNHIKRGDLEAALAQLERHHEQHDFKLDVPIYNIVLNAAVKARNKQVVEQMLKHFTRWSIPYNSFTYLTLLLWYGTTKQVREIEKVWQQLKSTPHLITVHIIGCMLTGIRKHKLGRRKLNEVLDIAKQQNISLSSTAYRELLLFYRDLDDMTKTMEVYDEYMTALSRGEVESHPHIWNQFIYMYSLHRPSTL